MKIRRKIISDSVKQLTTKATLGLLKTTEEDIDLKADF